MKAPAAPDAVSFFSSGGGGLRSRSVGAALPAGEIGLPALPARLRADWERQILEAGEGGEGAPFAVGEVEVLPLARARTRWPEFRLCVAEAGHWLASQGLPAGLQAAGEMALMACRGARYHHDGARYGGAAFFNVFVGDDRGLDLHFAATGRRIPLVRGTAVVFDTCQPHAVIPRGSTGFDERDFLPGHDWAQYFLTWELPVEHPEVAAALGVAFDVDPAAAARLSVPQVRIGGFAAEVCPASGRWRATDASPVRRDGDG